MGTMRETLRLQRLCSRMGVLICTLLTQEQLSEIRSLTSRYSSNCDDRFMPPSMPIANIPRVGVVFARLIVGKEDLGLRGFIVPLADKSHMKPGVQSQ